MIFFVWGDVHIVLGDQWSACETLTPQTEGISSLIILYYKIRNDSNNLGFSGLPLASSRFTLAAIFALDRWWLKNKFVPWVYPKVIWASLFCHTIQKPDRYYWPIWDQEMLQSLEFCLFLLFSVICFQSLLFWNKSEYIQQVSTVFFSKQSLYGSITYKLKKLWIQNFQGLFLMLKRSFICCYTTYMSEPFLSHNSKTWSILLIDLTSRNIAKSWILLIFQLLVFKVYCFGIKASTYNRFLLFSFLNKVFTGQ